MLVKLRKIILPDKVLAAISCCLAFFSASVFGEKIPFKYLTTADGLAHNRVTRIFQDRKGFLWFATWEGLSRFDGYNFVNYGTQDGLANQIINDITQDKQGRIWAAANDGGISRLTDETSTDDFGSSRSEKFTTFRVGSTYFSNKVNRFLIDSKNNLWCLTDDGLYRAAVSDKPVFSLVKANPTPLQDFGSNALFEDKQGNIWFTIYHELFEIRGENEIINHGAIKGFEGDYISNAIQDKKGKIFVLGWENGLFEFVSSTSQWRKISSDLQGISYFSALIEDDENSLWFGGGGGLLKLSNGKITKYSTEQGLSGNSINSLFQDREGNLWIGDMLSGINKFSGEAIVSYPIASTTDDIQKQNFIQNILKPNDSSGTRFLSSFFTILYSDKKWRISYNINNQSPLLNPVMHLQNGKEINVTEFFDKPPKEDESISFYDDERGVLWFSKNGGFIYRMNSAVLGKSEIEKFPCDISNQKVSFDLIIDDRRGNLWLFRRGLLPTRLRNGQCKIFTAESKIPDFNARSVFLDSRGWLWIGTRYEGVAVTKNPEAEIPDFKFYTVEDGLLSSSVWSITEDESGRIYLSTGRGLNRFEPNTERWQSYTPKDGLLSDSIEVLIKDSQGRIWIITPNGISKFDPDLERKTLSAPPIYITKIKIAGENLPLTETGFVETSAVELDSAKNNLTIDFVGLQFKDENALSYQHKLEGTDKDWSKPDKNRTITFANLAPGNYRFLVRAVNQEGLISNSPAVFGFEIFPPFYLRWWFFALAILTFGTIIYALYRVRVEKLLEMERTRMLIATDLHDDIGANLSKISVLSEVLRMQIANKNKNDDKLLGSIAEISRQSVDSMSDIVWAINPQRDSVREIVRKMRENAEEIFVPKGIRVKFVEPEKAYKIKLPMDLRRDLYLIYKEAINNIAKHSAADLVNIGFYIAKHEIILTIEDDGKGFDLREETNGNGLTNMRMRIERLKGTFEIESEENRGTKISIRIPQN